jgi:hypothetical protein
VRRDWETAAKKLTSFRSGTEPHKVAFAVHAGFHTPPFPEELSAVPAIVASHGGVEYL